RTYTVTASTYAHQLRQASFTLKEGETRNLLIALEPIEPFLELVHPQTVFHPEENVKVGVRGFISVDELQVQVWKVQLGATKSNVSLTTVLKFLNEVREGWWRGSWELKEKLQQISPCLTKVSETEVSITQRDVEGVFLRFLPVSVKSEGIYLVRFSSENLERIALVELTRVGLVVKLGRDRYNTPAALAYTADLKTGEPISGIEVSAWVSGQVAGRSQDRKIVSSITDENGMALLPLDKLNLDNLSAFFFIASEPTAEGHNPLAWVMMEEYELPNELNSFGTLSGAIYTDRPVYRPGNSVHFKGILREQTSKGYQPPKSTPFTLLVRDPDGNIVHRTNVTLTGFGSFSGSLTLNDEAPTGTYTIEAIPQNEIAATDRITGSFTVAAYRKPEIQVTVKPLRSRFSRSDTVTVTVTARYYFGMPVAGAEVSYWVTRLPVIDEHESNGLLEGYGGETVLEGETRTNANGQATIQFKPTDLPSEAPPFSEFRYEVYVTVEAAGYQFAEGTTSFFVTQGDWKLTVLCEPSFIGEKQTTTAKAKVTHWDTKKPQGNAVVHWRAGWVEWIGRDDMKVRWQLQGQTKTDSNGEAEWKFVPTEPGDWMVEATVYDQRNNAIGAESYVWVVSFTRAPTLPPKLPPIQLWLDKTQYRVGEEAKIALRSKLQNAAVLVTVEGERLFDARLLRLNNGTAEWRFPISPELLPNAYVTASLVHKKRLAHQIKPIKFKLDDFRLQVIVKSDREVYEPRQTARLTIQVRDGNGNPVKGELSIAVVDEAIYAIKGDDPEQVFRAFYYERPNRIITRYSFPWLAWQGDKGEAETIRKYFPDTALWLPHIVTDENGTTQVELKVPDTLTQWRVTAIANTLDTKIGYGIAKFRCTKPFGIRVAAPIVLTQGDQTTLSVIVHNDNEKICKANVVVEAESGGLTISHRDELFVQPHKTAAVKWNFKAERSGRWRITAWAKNDLGQTDAEQRVITVLPHAIEQVLARSFFLAADEAERKVAIVLPVNADLQTSRIHLRIAPSVFSAILGALDYLATYPYGCVEQTMNSLLPNLMVWRVIKERNIKVSWLERELPQMVQRGLTRLYRFQHEDGGWGWWEDDPTDLWMTALVVRGLAEAKKSGFEVSEQVLERGIKSLERMLQEGWNREDGDTVSFALFALARAGAKFPNLKPANVFTPAALSNTQTQSLNSLINRCSPYGLAFLTLALREWGHPQARQIAKKLLMMTLPLQEGFRWTMDKNFRMRHWTTDDEITAWALLALMRVGGIDARSASMTVKTLLQHRKGEGWISTKDTAAVLEAILEFANRYEKVRTNAPFTVNIDFNGSSQTIQIPPDAASLPEINVKLADGLKIGVNEVRVRKPKGMTLWVTSVNRRSLILPERVGELLASKRRVQRQYEKLIPYISEEGQVKWRTKPLKKGDAVKVGDTVQVTLTVDCPTDFMVLEDPLPGGTKVVEGRALGIDTDNYFEMEPKEVRDDRTITYFREAGRYVVRYLLRAEVPGDYHILPPRLWHMYGTDRWNGAEDRLRVLP
ncbi:MAG: MG2 domain-containing protein, partial [Armatimonadetes bacterium]|nr:MG2 domain-containing protein [Armatimonadota bacterium]